MIAAKAVAMLLMDALKSYGLYLLVVVVGTGILMFVAGSIGYGAYGDRPGIGWFGFRPNFSVANAEFLGSFVLFTTWMSLLSLYIPALMLLTAGIRRLRLPRIAVALILMPPLALATFWLLAAAGWYIAIDGVFVVVGIALSILRCCVVGRRSANWAVSTAGLLDKVQSAAESVEPLMYPGLNDGGGRATFY